MWRMAIRFTILVFMFLAVNSRGLTAQPALEKGSFYKAMGSANVKQMDTQLGLLKNIAGTDREAFEGAMLMRKSETLPIPAKKLALFRQGHKKLEAAIVKSPENAEYRFLRLMVQENAPRSLGYYKNIEQDGKFIKENYKSLAETTQHNVVVYSKKSKALAGYF